MKNYVLVLILCGFSIRKGLSQGSRRVFTFYPGQQSLTRPLSTESGQLADRSRFDQGQYPSTGFQQVDTSHQNQYETQSGPRMIDRQIRASSQNQYASDNVNVPKVIYFNSPQREIKVSESHTQPGNLNQHVNSFNEYENVALNRQLPSEEYVSTPEDAQLGWTQRGSGDPSRKQEVTYFIVPSGEAFQNNVPSTLRRDQQPPQGDPDNFANSDRNRHPDGPQSPNNGQGFSNQEEYNQPKVGGSTADQYKNFQITDRDHEQYSIPQFINTKDAYVQPQDQQSFRVKTNQYQSLTNSDREHDRSVQIPQSLPNVQPYGQNNAPNRDTYAQPQDQQSFRVKTNEYDSPTNSDREHDRSVQRPQSLPNVQPYGQNNAPHRDAYAPPQDQQSFRVKTNQYQGLPNNDREHDRSVQRPQSPPNLQHNAPNRDAYAQPQDQQSFRVKTNQYDSLTNSDREHDRSVQILQSLPNVQPYVQNNAPNRDGYTQPQDQQSFRIKTNQYQSLPNNDREHDRSVQRPQSPPNLQNNAPYRDVYVQPQDQQSFRVKTNQYQSLPNSDREHDRSFQRPQFLPNVQTNPKQFQRPSAVQANPVESQIILSGPPSTQFGSGRVDKSGYQSPTQFQAIPDQNITSPYLQQQPRITEGHQNTQQINQTRPTYPSQTVNTNTTAAAVNAPKRPFYINTFAADLYITKKPCEVCCGADEMEPCHSCCKDATALLNSRTLKTAVG